MLTPSNTNWRAQYDRMMRSYERVTGPYLSSVVYNDDLHHFMQDCWHLKDWIRNDASAGIGKAIEKEVAACKSLRIAADLANASKHLTRHTDREDANLTSTNVTVHLGSSRPIDTSYIIALADNTQMTVETLVHVMVADWDVLLKKLGLIQ